VNNRTIGWDVINGYVVSTVRLPIDHGFGQGPPLWYETMIFRATEEGRVADWGELHCARYTTMEQARTGHECAKTLAANDLLQEATT
jgi:hypothetical protein